MTMPLVTILYSAALIVLGLAGYLLTAGESVTALIPAFFGAAVLAAGLLALREKFRKHAMHAASLLALFGMIGTASGVPATFQLIAGQDVERPEAAVCKAIMALLSCVFFILCLRSFVKARLARK
jgi:hypothetical protein